MDKNPWTPSVTFYSFQGPQNKLISLPSFFLQIFVACIVNHYKRERERERVCVCERERDRESTFQKEPLARLEIPINRIWTWLICLGEIHLTLGSNIFYKFKAGILLRSEAIIFLCFTQSVSHYQERNICLLHTQQHSSIKKI